MKKILGKICHGISNWSTTITLPAGANIAFALRAHNTAWLLAAIGAIVITLVAIAIDLHNRAKLPEEERTAVR